MRSAPLGRSKRSGQGRARRKRGQTEREQVHTGDACAGVAMRGQADCGPPGRADRLKTRRAPCSQTAMRPLAELLGERARIIRVSAYPNSGVTKCPP